jgi:hypothetical protein
MEAIGDHAMLLLRTAIEADDVARVTSLLERGVVRDLNVRFGGPGLDVGRDADECPLGILFFI